MEKVAKIITFVFDPSLTIPFMATVLIFKTGLTSEQIRVVLPLVLLTDIVLPGVFWFLSLKKHWISDWEISKRTERFNLYLIFSSLFFLGTVVSFYFGNKILVSLHLIFNLTFFLATLVTFFWKISIHMLIDTLGVSFLNIIFGNVWFLYLLLPLIAWSRYVRHKHTPAQLLAGFLLAMLIVFLGVNLAHL